MPVDRLTGNSPETDRFWRPMDLRAGWTKSARAVHAHSSTRDARDPVRAGPNLTLLTTETVASDERLSTCWRRQLLKALTMRPFGH